MAKAELMISKAQKKKKRTILTVIIVVVVVAIGVMVAKIAMDSIQIENAKKAYEGMVIKGDYTSAKKRNGEYVIEHHPLNNTLTFSGDNKIKLHLVEYTESVRNKYSEDFDSKTISMEPVDFETAYSASSGEIRIPSKTEVGGPKIEYSGFSNPKLTRVTVYVHPDNVLEAYADYDNKTYDFRGKIPSIGNAQSAKQVDKGAYVGEWVLVDGSDENMSKENLELLNSMGFRITLTLNENGTGSFNVPDEQMNVQQTDLTWGVSGEGASATINGAKASMKLEGDNLVVASDEGQSMTFEKS